VLRRLSALAAAAALLVTFGLVAGTASAEAATKPSVTIKTLKGRTAPYRKSVTVGLPSITTKSNVDVSSTTFTIKHGKKTVVRNKKTAKLKAGRYKVTTTVKYRTWKVVTVTPEPETVVILPAGESVAATCVVTEAVPDADLEASYAITLGCTSSASPDSATLTGHAVGDSALGYTINLDHSHDEPALYSGDSLVGIAVAANIYFDTDLTRIEVGDPYQEQVYSATKKKARTQTLVIKQGRRPGRTDPISEYKCPSWAPIKGNAQSMIYHLPGQRFYKVTKPEDCFSTQAAARRAGYRKAKV
jgi:hypothetical protein